MQTTLMLLNQRNPKLLAQRRRRDRRAGTGISMEMHDREVGPKEITCELVRVLFNLRRADISDISCYECDSSNDGRRSELFALLIENKA